MISEKDFKNYEEIIFPEESEENYEKIKMEKIYEIIGRQSIYEILPNYDPQDEIMTEIILEIYKVLYWGSLALVFALLWLYFFIY